MATFTFVGQDANNTSNASTLVVNNTGALNFTFDSGAENFIGDDQNTEFNEGADDTVTYVNYDGVLIENVTFEITYVGVVNWANGNQAINPDASTKVMIIRITSGPETGQTYTIIVGDPPPPTTNGTFSNGNHRASPPENPIICFARGTMIRTPQGDVAIEDLRAGDLVITAATGAQPIRWVGSTRVLAHDGNRPIRISAGALGDNLPERDLLVSPAHRMVVSGWRAEVMFGQTSILARARDLVNDSTIRPATDIKRVEYFHMMFDSHQIVFSNGAQSESLHPRDSALDSMAAETRAEVLALFPDLASRDNYGPDALPTLQAAEAAVFARL